MFCFSNERANAEEQPKKRKFPDGEKRIRDQMVNSRLMAMAGQPDKQHHDGSSRDEKENKRERNKFEIEKPPQNRPYQNNSR